MAPDKTENSSEKGQVALLIIDMISDFEFEDSEQILSYAPEVARKIAALKAKAFNSGVPVIYVNDNYGKWQSDFKKQVQHCLTEPVPGRGIVEKLLPTDDDYFVLKPKHSGFFSTTLEILLNYLEVETVVLTGIAGNICILFTASDAYMRDFKVVVPPDCIASNTRELNDQALGQIESVMSGQLIPSSELDWQALKQGQTATPVK